MATDNTTVTFPIVGIGASAGGLEALEQFFHHIATDSGMAFVLIQHLSPDHASLLAEILQRTTTMPVAEALDQIPVEPNHVYIIPPNRDMTILHGMLQLAIPDQPRGQRMPIDLFFRSLAQDQQENAIGIILSGTGTDGTLGLRAIQGAGGLTLAQDPDTAKYSGMLSSAIEAGYVSRILPADKLPEALLLGTRSFVGHVETPIAPKAINGINRILMQLRTSTGHDFSLYKKNTIVRRIQRRMAQHIIEDTDVYARYLKETPDEVRLLFNDLLINVTSFFRDAEAFTVLEKNILPQLCKDNTDDTVFRVWIAGCATGEEAYSIAILLCELMEKTHQSFKVQIYGTDLDDNAINTARAGLYPVNIIEDVSAERLSRFFTKEDAGYRIKKHVREMVVFAVQNVIKDPPFTRLDLLCCRNLMIYLEPELQTRLIPAFHYALKPNGVLFLSPSEGISNHTDLFLALDRKWKLYRAQPSEASTRAVMVSPVSWTVQRPPKSSMDTMKHTQKTNFSDITQRALVQFFAPASIITDLKGTILYVHGETGKYLRPAPGQASLNVIEMARDGLELELRTAIYTAANGKIPTLNREMPVKTNGGFSTVSLSVRPLPDSKDSQNLLLVSFQDIVDPVSKPERKHFTKPDKLEHIEELQREIAYLKESYQVAIEEHQASNEELRATNEEMQSVNEELQSTNEELETSKEELQSVNEELITVNAELQSRIEQLIDIQNDMKNLLDNTNIGTIFLDEHLIIRRFTRDATKLYPLVASDINRPLSDIKSNFAEDNLITKARAVLESLVPFEQEIHTVDNLWYLARIQPYRTLDNVIKGIVLTFTDISTRKEAQMAVDRAQKLAENIIATIPQPLLVLNDNLEVISANRAFYHYFHVTVAETVGHKIYNLGNSQWDIPALRELLENILPRDEAFDKYAIEHDFPIIGHRKMLLNARRIIDQTGQAQQILLLIEVGQ